MLNLTNLPSPSKFRKYSELGSGDYAIGGGCLNRVFSNSQDEARFLKIGGLSVEGWKGFVARVDYCLIARDSQILPRALVRAG